MGKELSEVDVVVGEPAAIRPSERCFERALEVTILEHVVEDVRLRLGPQLAVLGERPGEDACSRPRRADDEYGLRADLGNASRSARDCVQVSGRRLGGLRFGLSDPPHPKRIEGPAIELPELVESSLLELALVAVASLDLAD